jgi:hypothetical protein
MTVLANDRTDQLLARRTKLLPKDSIRREIDRRDVTAITGLTPELTYDISVYNLDYIG